MDKVKDIYKDSLPVPPKHSPRIEIKNGETVLIINLAIK